MNSNNTCFDGEISDMIRNKICIEDELNLIDNKLVYFCSVCLVEYDQNNSADIVLFSICNHFICLKCFEEYKKHHFCCPICRNSIESYAIIKSIFLKDKTFFHIENNTCFHLANKIKELELGYVNKNVNIEDNKEIESIILTNDTKIDNFKKDLIENKEIGNQYSKINKENFELNYIKFIKPDLLIAEENFHSITKDEINLEIKLLENILIKIHVDLFGRWNSKNELFMTSFYNKTLSILEEVKDLNLKNGNDNHYEFNKKILELLAICSGNVEKMRKNQFSSEDKLEILKNDEDLFALSIPNPTNFQVIKKKKIRRGSS